VGNITTCINKVLERNWKEKLINEIKGLNINDSTALVIEEDQTEIMLEDFKFKAVKNETLKEVAEIISKM